MIENKISRKLDIEIMLQLLKATEGNGEKNKKISFILNKLSDIQTKQFTNGMLKTKDEYERIRNSKEYTDFANLLLMVLKLNETLLEMKIVPVEIQKYFNSENETLYNYHLKNFYIRISALIDGCMETINLAYNLQLEGRECIVKNIKRKLKEKNIDSKAFRMICRFNHLNYDEFIKTKNSIIHQCKFKYDFIKIFNELQTWMLDCLNMDENEYDLIYKKRKDDILKYITDGLNTIIDGMDESLYKFLSQLMDEINLSNN